jgi:hypothetical protein
MARPLRINTTAPSIMSPPAATSENPSSETTPIGTYFLKPFPKSPSALIGSATPMLDEQSLSSSDRDTGWKSLQGNAPAKWTLKLSTGATIGWGTCFRDASRGSWCRKKPFFRSMSLCGSQSGKSQSGEAPTRMGLEQLSGNRGTIGGAELSYGGRDSQSFWSEKRQSSGEVSGVWGHPSRVTSRVRLGSNLYL